MKIILIVLLSQVSVSAFAQFVARMEVKKPIKGVCDQKNVFAILPGFKDQEEAVCPVSREDIFTRLNSEIEFVKANPKFDGKGMIGLVINCKGKVVQCRMDNKTKNAELDEQIEVLFQNLGEWKPGKVNDKEVDTSWLFSFKIKNGNFSPQ